MLAKCPSKYEMEKRSRNGEQMPHGPLARLVGSDRSVSLSLSLASRSESSPQATFRVRDARFGGVASSP